MRRVTLNLRGTTEPFAAGRCGPVPRHLTFALIWLLPLALHAQEAAAPAPAAGTEWITGTVDLGYRWVTGVGGSFDTYRSVVNLGEGPKLFGVDLTFNGRAQPVARHFFDKLTATGIGWGGDPYTTARVEASKERIYHFTFDYRNIAFFDALPSFANPFSGEGVYLDQRAYDSRRRLADFSLELRPGTSLVPYLEYTHNSENGTGVTDFVSDANAYPVANFLRSQTNTYRGGLRIQRAHYHVTLEEGAAVFKDDQQVTDTTPNSGNRSTPLLGQNLYIDSLLQAYGIRGNAPYSRALFTANPTSWLDLYGQFQYSQGITDVNYQQANTGSMVALSSLLFYNGEEDLLVGAAKQPHTSANVGAEVRPLKHLRIIENWTTDRLHTSSSNTLLQALTTMSGPLPPTTTPASDRLVDNYNQQSLDILYDVTNKITVRAGHRYVYGDTTVRAPFAGGTETGKLNRQAAVAGISYRPGTRISANFDFEGGLASHAYYRTSLQNYAQYRGRVRYQALNSLSLTYELNDLENTNPIPSVEYTFSSKENGLSLQWTPNGGKRISLLGDYSRTSLESNILYVIPQSFQSAQSLYRENANQATAQMDLVLPKLAGRAGRLTLGGSLYYGSGSRPTHYYQPLAKLALPLGSRADWVSEWRWYGFDEPFYVFEAFRATLVTTGFRLRL
jgi:hypothetical protein